VGKKLVSIVIPAYNEEAVIPELGRALRAMMDRNPAYDFEAVIVENGSADNSWAELTRLHESDPRFRIVRLSRNFTADGGVAAGLRHASGDCAILMDADLQDPPEVIDLFLKKWEEGHQVVYGIIRSRRGVSPLRKLINKVFYFLLEKLTGGMIPPDVTAFRLMDRCVYSQLNAMPETNRFTRGLCAWTGFSQVGVEFERAERFAGETKAPFWDIFTEALDALFSFSFLPLRVITFFGLMLSTLCFVLLIVILAVVLIQGNDLPGFPTIILTMLIMFGCMFIALGIMGEYLARVFAEVKGRPIFIVRETLGLRPPSEKESK